MGDRIDRMPPDKAPHQPLFPGLPDHAVCPFGHGPHETGGEIIENDDSLAGGEKAQSHIPADIAGASSDQHTHAQSPFDLSNTVLSRKGAAWIGPAGTDSRIAGIRRARLLPSYRPRNRTFMDKPIRK